MLKINFKLIFKICLSLGLILFLSLNLKLDKIDHVHWDVFIHYTIAILIALTSLAIMSIRWKLLIENFSPASLPYLELLRYYTIGAFFNIFLPGSIGGDVVRTRRLSQKSEIKIRKATLITLFERFSGVYGLLILLSFSFLFMNFPDGLNFDNYLPIWTLRISPLIILICIPVLKIVLSKYRLVSSYSFILKVISISIIAQFGDIVIAFLFSQYFDLAIPFSAFFFIMPLVFVATVLPISLGGLGVREGTFSALMILYGVDSSLAIMIAFLMYLVKVGVGIIGYLIYLKEK